jgi:hypothetical protein
VIVELPEEVTLVRAAAIMVGGRTSQAERLAQNRLS